MRQIYSKAEKVVVFVGDGRGHRVRRSDLYQPYSPTMTLHGDERDRPHLESFLKLCNTAKLKEVMSLTSVPLCALSLVRTLSEEPTMTRDFAYLMALREDVRRYLFECLRAFLVSPWWDRIWVVQELAVSLVAVVHYGNTVASWRVLVDAAVALSPSNIGLPPAVTRLEPENLKVLSLLHSRVSTLQRTRDTWRTHGGVELVRLLHEFSNRRASDDRDKVYGLLGLAKQGYDILPNYEPEHDVLTTYCDTAFGVIQAEESLTCWIGDQKRKNHKDLPSWIPDWSTAFDEADSRRMDLNSTYNGSRDWKLRIVADELEYWISVGKQMEELVDSLEERRADAKQLPAWLLPHVVRYENDLLLRHEALDVFFPNGEFWPWQCLKTLQWYHEQDHTLPLSASIRAGAALNKWTWQLNMHLRTGRTFVGPKPGSHEHWLLINFQKAWAVMIEAREMDPASRKIVVEAQLMRFIEHEFEWIEDIWTEDFSRDTSAVSEKETEEQAQARLVQPNLEKRLELDEALSELISQCRRFATFCTAEDHGFETLQLFGSSYTFRSKATWMQSIQQRREPTVPWFTRPSPVLMLESPNRCLPIQSIRLDRIERVGSKLLSWSDTKAALGTLASWFDLISLGVQPPTWEELGLFAQTILGGVDRPDANPGLYGDGLHTLTSWLDDYFQHERMWTGFTDSHIDTLTRQLAKMGPSAEKIPLLEEIRLATESRVFFVTESEAMGLGPGSSQPGDTIHIFPSGRTHFLLRKPVKTDHLRESAVRRTMKSTGDPDIDCYELIGDCYFNNSAMLPTDIPGFNGSGAEDEPSLRGSLPYELLGTEVLRAAGYDHVKSIWLI